MHLKIKAPTLGYLVLEEEQYFSPLSLLANSQAPIFAYLHPSGTVRFTFTGRFIMGATDPLPSNACPVVGLLPALAPHDLGCPTFLDTHAVMYAYVTGAMAGGINSTEMVIAMAKAGMLSFFGAGGLDLNRIEQAIVKIQAAIPGQENYGFNLLSNPISPQIEWDTVNLYLRYGVCRIEASAFTQITPALVYYRVKGLKRGENQTVIAQNHIFAKLSRPELAQQFMEPPPLRILEQLLADRLISQEEAKLALEIPLAEDITAEGDSGGHTDRMPTLALLSAIQSVRDAVMAQRNYTRRIRIGAAGGIGTPTAAAAAFTAGADYVVTGSINQSCVEAGTSEIVKEMLAEAEINQTEMAPAADMFELGAQVQVLKNRTLFPNRAKKLYQIYRNYPSWQDIPQQEREDIEKRYFRSSFEQVWQGVQEYFSLRDPKQLIKAAEQPKHQMALVFRWYLGLSSRWAQQGTSDRAVDFQIWCGPVMGSFNHWVKGSFMESHKERYVAVVALNILHGAAAVIRARMLSMQGVSLPKEAFQFAPRRFEG
ncbi:MAG: PfaD family polyunsaturated fatty acid/polyketide biosynthesis protein [Chlorogloeopsis fritschii C42_A2020_084]|uniref:PfaD family polyunsaturated fatty acid/polyketide biosynthesis protein n=1 Tax=Chlorogloeopsis fritschii TaxID=1124 RepID=UPI0019EBA80B|nr:PfaD family polyunsaturated fatty acid/polyketide biosynthesis protein [Chlorogloeopsis fritschii]MBF2006662.1 PfaD family polyunsaturated fatty acid/polyketide biosynthesis protein [Chlorogloeopsis fritschii C42_A2020_084]